MYLVAIAWGYVVLIMSVVEALSPQGTVLGAIFTCLLYGVLPLGVVLYLMGTPARRRARKAQEAQNAQMALETHGLAEPTPASTLPPDGSGHAPGGAVAAERKEP